MSSREERLAANEELFRQVNERIVELTDAWHRELDLVCECADPECAQRLVLTTTEYEQLRQQSNRFAVLPGHELPEIETVIDCTDRYLIVEKHLGAGTEPDRPRPR